ncbi:MAG: 23S rRNA (adenine(2503)-C(2))-methyltransferase RlmN [Flavobacteriaceae bacterium]|nr:23S rRNA (adenine(2503)-C(2))-methyltransferase RlmN [Flavobacteriaceae bacterium]
MPNLRSLSPEELTQLVASIGEKPFRAKQLYEWLWKNGASEFDDMSNLPAGFREKLSQEYTIDKVKIDHSQTSRDRTIKTAFRLHDDHLIEGVLIPTDTRMTACISSQVGCSLACKFCATGKMDRLRNLDHWEIYDQVALIKKQAEDNYGIPLSNIVYMGMGEPLLNYTNMLKSTQMISSPDGLGMSPQRITVSTAGIAKMIKKLGDDEVKFNLALSLHAASDAKRNEIMGINETNNLTVLAEALRYFHEKTGTRITFEYIVFDGFNDSLDDAADLARFARNVPVKINLIEYNPIGDGLFQNAKADRIEDFRDFLESRNLIVNIRRSRGKDIDAACGQLANKG